MNKSFISKKILPLALSAAMVIGNFATVYADEITDDYDIKTEGLDNSIDGQSDEDSVTGDTTYYTVHIADDIVNGSVYLKDGDDATTNDISVAAGDTVYVTAVEDEGYEFSDIKAYDIDSQELQLTAQDDEVYYFTMPQSDVEVKAAFSKKETKDISTKESSENTDDKNTSSVSQGGVEIIPLI